MSKGVINIANLSPEARAEFQSLTRAPKLARPTIVLWAVLTTTFISTYWFCGTRQWPLWLGMLLNSTIGYIAFSLVHDSIHRAISTSTRANDFFGQSALLLVVPYVDLRMFRWAHILHHRFAVGPRDPDNILRGPWWSLPFRWMAIDGLYFIHALKNGDKVSKPYLRSSLILAVLSFALLGWIIHAGYGTEALMLWFIPSRLVLLMLGFSFFWLPHVPHDVSQEENFTRATTVRIGQEWLLGPLLQYQNYHLIHHLYPMTPFYNNNRVWTLIEPELRKKDLAIQAPFAIHPTIHHATA